MSHLTPEELLDLTEGTRTEAQMRASSHLTACAACRDQLADLRAALAVVDPVDSDVPEPSPLFWEHFSARVHQAIASEPAPRRLVPPKFFMGEWSEGGWSFTERWLSWKVTLSAAACLVALLATAVMFRTTSAPPTAADEIVGNPVVESVPSLVDDPSWSLMTDLAGDLDWDAAIEAGLTPAAGGVERAIFDLSADERFELRRLLQEELSGSGV